MGLIVKNRFDPLEISCSDIPFSRDEELLVNLRLLSSIKTVVVAQIFQQFEVFFPLLRFVVQQFASPIDFFVVVGKNVLLFKGVQNGLFHFLVVLHDAHQVLRLQHKPVLLVIIEANLLDHSCLGEVGVMNAEKPAYLFVEREDVFVLALLGVDFKRAVIFAGGLVEEKVDLGVFDFFLNFVLSCHLDSILYAQI